MLSCKKEGLIDRGKEIAKGTADQLKEQLGGDVLDIKVKNKIDLARVAELVRPLGKPQIAERTGRVTVAVKDRVAGLLLAANAIQEAAIELDDLGVHRPSLDDVFLALTGHDAAESEAIAVPRPGRSGRRGKAA